MLVFKFGGASVKDAAGVINLAKIVAAYQSEQLLIVVSAMGKTTNALEKLTEAYVNQSEDIELIFNEIKTYHYQIMSQLFEPDDAVYNDVANTFVEIDWMVEEEPHDDLDFIYDQIVSVGELVSTRIVAAYLNKVALNAKWLDVRGYIHTDNTYREGIVDWDKTRAQIAKDIPPVLQNNIVITQGFLGGTSENFTTTLGREGSDYTAAIFAACLGAQSVTTWKDVPGILNADPKFFTETLKFDNLSYTEAIEMTFYGAGVIHPKTIKPLQNAGIPLIVRSFTDMNAAGTTIGHQATAVFSKPVIILKHNQVMLSVSAKDHSFITEEHLSTVFKLFADRHVKINVMQVSALSFTVCFDYRDGQFEKLLITLQQTFNAKYNRDLSLLTLRHYKPEDLTSLTQGRKILLEQISRNTAQVVLSQ
ncbi:aspartate kinase [Mucilaginibacter ginkgonis]|uniref:Aspartokinase n=1 Tax=Mucilaginibacter ginkgonis TaxID=2682091 RepID=A0A6I4IMY9_9SPHI|nr:aspartate kinase [Mucilaginibacter ginkgonis]QQL51276.1 aspartate kinase [Mucilaginibacter ginkgonis]